MHPGLYLPHPTGQRILAFVKPVDVPAFPRELPLQLAELHIAPHRHPVAHILGKQIQPVVIPAVIQQVGLIIQERFHVLPQQQHCQRIVGRGHSAA